MGNERYSATGWCKGDEINKFLFKNFHLHPLCAILMAECYLIHLSNYQPRLVPIFVRLFFFWLLFFRLFGSLLFFGLLFFWLIRYLFFHGLFFRLIRCLFFLASCISMLFILFFLLVNHLFSRIIFNIFSRIARILRILLLVNLTGH